MSDGRIYLFFPAHINVKSRLVLSLRPCHKANLSTEQARAAGTQRCGGGCLDRHVYQVSSCLLFGPI